MLHVLKCPNDLNEYYTLRTRDWNGILRRATLLSPEKNPEQVTIRVIFIYHLLPFQFSVGHFLTVKLRVYTNLLGRDP